MRSEKWLTGLTGAALAFTLALGSSFCLVSGFQLELADPAGLTLFCGVGAAFASGCLLFRQGTVPVLCAWALGLGYLWHLGEPLRETLALITKISRVYNSAYHWGWLALSETWQESAFDWPVTMLAAVTVTTASYALCRGRFLWLAAGSALFPLGLCLVVTDTVPESPYLFALMAGLAILILTSGIRRENRRQACRLTAMVTVPVLLFTALLFTAFPKENYVNRAENLRAEILQWGSRMPEQLVDRAELLASERQNSELQDKEELGLDLSGVGPQRKLTAPVLEVTSEAGGLLYLRQQSFGTYTGRQWLQRENRETMAVSGTPDTVTIRTRILQDMLLVPWYPAGKTQLASGRVENTAGVREYTLSRVLPETAFPSEPGEMTDLAAFRELPQNTREMALSFLEGHLDPELSAARLAEQIGRLVSSGARYDLNAQRMPEDREDFALWFLTACDRGYCIHFATAATVLLRSAGIPARYVTGYLVNTNPGEPVTVTAGHAHAWAEYYDDAAGLWRILEATPEGAPESPAETEAASEPEEERILAEPEKAASDPAETSPEPEEPDGTGAAPFLLILPGILLAILLQRFFRQKAWERKFLKSNPNERGLLLWKKTEALANLLGETPPEVLYELAQKARFSQHTLTEEELEVFHQQLLSSRLRLKEAPWYKKLVHQYWFAAY